MTLGLDLQHSKAAVLVVESNALNEPGETL